MDQQPDKEIMDAIKEVSNHILGSIKKELEDMKNPDDLENFWYFEYDNNASKSWNTYQFFKFLDLYSDKCRRWEEIHNGYQSVVERVRDKYTMPKIKEFLDALEGNSKGYIRITT